MVFIWARLRSKLALALCSSWRWYEIYLSICNCGILWSGVGSGDCKWLMIGWVMFLWIPGSWLYFLGVIFRLETSWMSFCYSSEFSQDNECIISVRLISSSLLFCFILLIMFKLWEYWMTLGLFVCNFIFWLETCTYIGFIPYEFWTLCYLASAEFLLSYSFLNSWSFLLSNMLSLVSSRDGAED